MPTPLCSSAPVPRKRANDSAGRRKGAPDLSIVASFRALAAGALDRRRHALAWPGFDSADDGIFFVALRPNVDLAPSGTTSLRKGSLR
jgi:hypothetical protein